MNSPWKAALQESAVSGTLASILSTAALAVLGRRENGSSAAPGNATSHWVWGDEALYRDRYDARHTLAGYAIHHVASTFWAVLHARVMHGRPGALQPVPALAAAGATAAMASLVDLRFAPRRFTPGFERRLSAPGLVLVYAAFGVGLLAGSVAVNRRRAARRAQGSGSRAPAVSGSGPRPSPLVAGARASVRAGEAPPRSIGG